MKSILFAAIVLAIMSTGCSTKSQCKLVPYNVCESVQVPVIDTCGNVVAYRQTTQVVTRYKKACCN